MTALALALWCATAAHAQVSSGGDYRLDRSAVVSGGAPAAGGDFKARGSAASTAGSQPTPGHVIQGGAFELRVGVFNPPPFAIQASSPVLMELAGGALTVSVPSAAVPMALYDIAFAQDPVAKPIVVNPNKIVEANSKIEAFDSLARVRPENIWEFHVAGEEGYFSGNFRAPMRLAFSYTDANGDGVIDGTNPPVRAKTLAVWTLDEAAGRWIRVPGFSVDTVARTVSVSVAHFSVYAFIAGTDDDVSGAYAYPVPWRPNGPGQGLGAGQSGTLGAGITFTNLPTEGSIEIYTLGGQLVRRLQIPLGLGVPQLTWDVRNRAGEAVVSGVYIWKVSSRSATKTGRLMVIR